VPGAWDRFEVAVRAVLGQQVTVRGATTLAGRLAQAFGESLAGADGELDRLFPRPEALVDADLSSVGLTRARAASIRGLAAAYLDGLPALTGSLPLDVAVAQLCTLPGIGEWTAQYIAMRGLREPDAFPAGDLGLRRTLAGGARLATPAAVLTRAEAWRPWRAYAALHLWVAAAAPPPA
jgi:AraC family transcriptional regulator of adaptative response / DNA-3-methyladenine glycosylase II